MTTLNNSASKRFLKTSGVRIFILAVLFAFGFEGIASAQNTSTICKFTSGPLAGTTHDYAPMAAIPVGSPCTDGAASNGVVIAKRGSGLGGMSTICKFTSGPLAGTTHDYAPKPAVAVGSPCTDGAASNGVVIAKPGNSGNGGSGSGGMSTICKFTSGPLAGTTHDYAPMAAIPVGSPCTDGAASNGVVIAKPGNPGNGGSGSGGMSTICKFTSGPLAGTTHDYAPKPAVAVGSQCQDGAGSSGKVIAKTGS
jgi:predicted hydrocarbon binding protein